jgi:transcription elongation factor
MNDAASSVTSTPMSIAFVDNVINIDGAIAIGGTGTANQLDDYEEGTWTPALNGGSWTTNSGTWAATGNYTKIGNVVTATFKHTAGNMTWGVGASLSGLPFSSPTGGLSSGTWINTQPNIGGELLGWGTLIYFAQAGSVANEPNLAGRLIYRV